VPQAWLQVLRRAGSRVGHQQDWSCRTLLQDKNSSLDKQQDKDKGDLQDRRDQQDKGDLQDK